MKRVVTSFPKIPVPRSFDRLDEFVDERWAVLRRSGALDRIFYTASEVGDFGMVWLAIAGTQAAFGTAERTRTALRLAAVLGCESIIVNGVIKSLFRRERPEWEQDRPLNLRRPRTSSFPSGHASSAVTAALLLSVDPTPWRPAYWALAGVVATSRIHVKIHHGSDVLAGALVGTVIGLAARRVPLRGWLP